jgi:hypothetical protein
MGSMRCGFLGLRLMEERSTGDLAAASVGLTETPAPEVCGPPHLVVAAILLSSANAKRRFARTAILLL